MNDAAACPNCGGRHFGSYECPFPATPTIGLTAAVLEMDPDGGWNHETTGGWPSLGLYSDLCRAVGAGLIETSTAYGAVCWRLTEEGIRFRSGIAP
jgi:hypothetical protein